MAKKYNTDSDGVAQALQNLDESLADYRNKVTRTLPDRESCFDRIGQLAAFEDLLDSGDGFDSSSRAIYLVMTRIGLLYLSRIVLEQTIELESP